MANNAYLFREADIALVKDAVQAKFPVTYQGKTFQTYNDWVNFTREDYRPIRIRDDAQGKRFVLPIEIKDNPNFAKLKEVIQSATNGVTAVQLTAADRPEEFIDGTPTDYSIPN